MTAAPFIPCRFPGAPGRGARRRFSAAAEKIRLPETLGFVPIVAAGIYLAIKESQADQKILNAFDSMYTNWLQSVGIARDKALEIVRAAVALYKAGMSRDRSNLRTVRDAIKTKLPGVDSLAVTKILMYLEGITKSNNPVLAAYMTPEGRTIQSYKTAAAQELQDRAESIKAGAVDTIKEAAQSVTESLPWYAKPKILAGAAAVGILLWYFNSAKGLVNFIRPKYQSNPVKSKREAARKMYKVFNDAEPRKTLQIPHVDADELAHLGTALEIGYKSKKWTGKNANYLHQFGKGVKLYATPDGKYLVIGGGQMSVKENGINN